MSASVDTAIGTENKGFKMLTKMGYKESGLGKHKNHGPGRASQGGAEDREGRAWITRASVTVDSRKMQSGGRLRRDLPQHSHADAFNQNDTDEDGES